MYLSDEVRPKINKKSTYSFKYLAQIWFLTCLKCVIFLNLATTSTMITTIKLAKRFSGINYVITKI